MGWTLVALGLTVAASSAALSTGVGRGMASGGMPPEMVAVLAPRVAWGNFAAAFTFVVLVATAVAFRRRPAVHARLMLLASVSMIAPALARILQWPVFGEAINASFFVLAMAGSFVLVAIVGVHDVLSTGRLHRATAAGGAFLILAKLLGVLVISGTAVGISLLS